MKWFKAQALNLILPMIIRSLPKVTDKLSGELKGFISGWAARALESPNGWDDPIALLLCTLVGVVPDGYESIEEATEAVRAKVKATETDYDDYLLMIVEALT